METASSRPTSTSEAPWPKSTRRLVTALLVFHLLAVMVPPLQLATTSSPVMTSPFVERVSWIFQPYDDAMFLNHGYAFFAPNPGSSFLLRAHLEFDDGRMPMVIDLPDVDRQTPRLLYHRYFMLSEHFNGAYPGVAEPVDTPPELIRQWRAAQDEYQRREESIISHLKHRYGAVQVRLERREHRLPTTFEFFEENVPLDSPESYRVLDDELEPEDRP